MSDKLRTLFESFDYVESKLCIPTVKNGVLFIRDVENGYLATACKINNKQNGIYMKLDGSILMVCDESFAGSEFCESHTDVAKHVSITRVPGSLYRHRNKFWRMRLAGLTKDGPQISIAFVDREEFGDSTKRSILDKYMFDCATLCCMDDQVTDGDWEVDASKVNLSKLFYKGELVCERKFDQQKRM